MLFAPMDSQKTPEQATMPLSMVGRGQTVIISQIRGGRQLRQRLHDLGLNPGARVRVVKNEMPGPLIVAVKEDGRLALGRGMTHHILVRIVFDNKHTEGV